MEDDVVVVALVREIDEVLTRLRGVSREQLDLDVAELGGNGRAGRVASCG
jgi:hypothetical protein